MSDERSERLRRNRNRAKERVQQSTELEETSDERSERTNSDKLSKPDKQSELDETNEQSESSVKDERVGTYMYLPENQQRELSRLYNVLKAEYEYEYETAFEKNRHFYPLVIEHGIDGLDGLDAFDIKTKLDSLAITASAE